LLEISGSSVLGMTLLGGGERWTSKPENKCCESTAGQRPPMWDKLASTSQQGVKRSRSPSHSYHLLKRASFARADENMSLNNAGGLTVAALPVCDQHAGESPCWVADEPELEASLFGKRSCMAESLLCLIGLFHLHRGP
jgi:hypothetical protein